MEGAAAVAGGQEVHHIVAGTEDAGLAEDDGDGDAIVRVACPERLSQRLVHLPRQRILLFGPVEPDGLHRALNGDLNKLAHR